jgi:hypothetical protein
MTFALATALLFGIAELPPVSPDDLARFPSKEVRSLSLCGLKSHASAR